jgi:hypothetical protein
MESIKDLLSSINGVSALAGGLGIGFFAMFGVVAKLRVAIKEVSELALAIKNRVNDPELRKDADDALEAIADVLQGVKMSKQAQTLRDAL